MGREKLKLLDLLKNSCCSTTKVLEISEKNKSQRTVPVFSRCLDEGFLFPNGQTGREWGCPPTSGPYKISTWKAAIPLINWDTSPSFLWKQEDRQPTQQIRIQNDKDWSTHLLSKALMGMSLKTCNLFMTYHKGITQNHYQINPSRLFPWEFFIPEATHCLKDLTLSTSFRNRCTQARKQYKCCSTLKVWALLFQIQTPPHTRSQTKALQFITRQCSAFNV